MHENDAVFDVAIVGAGFSGSMVAVHLSRLAPENRVLLADRKGAFGRGVAYGTEDIRHLLNVPAGKMSAFPDIPGHFAEWLEFRRSIFRSMGVDSISPDDFVPRKLYGTYIRDLLDEARRTTNRIEILRSQIDDIEPRGEMLHVTAENGETFLARQIVLALGNFPPGDPPLHDGAFHRSPRYLNDPWSPETLQRISDKDDILILGSGLTALDLIVSLDSVKSRGTIHILSRRGHFPQPHRRCQPQPQWFARRRFPISARGLVRLVRTEVKTAAAQGIDWRAIIDALRPHTQGIWQSLSLVERKRFMRHIRPIWESHRHRAAPPVLAAKDAMFSSDRLVLHRGHVRRITESNSDLTVTFFNSSTRCEQTLRVAYVINCTGPECNYQKLKSPLVVNLFARGLIHPDPLFLGIKAASDGAAIDYLGRPSTRIFTLGSAAKGMLFETTAVPELRLQAKALAERLLRVTVCG
jgi:uncharacterized NAD(P)/FAD-binding protein YdhS